MQPFKGDLVFKAHRLCVSLNSGLESNEEEEACQVQGSGFLGLGVPGFIFRVAYFGCQGAGFRLRGVGIEKGLGVDGVSLLGNVTSVGKVTPLFRHWGVWHPPWMIRQRCGGWRTRS